MTSKPTDGEWSNAYDRLQNIVHITNEHVMKREILDLITVFRRFTMDTIIQTRIIDVLNKINDSLVNRLSIAGQQRLFDEHKQVLTMAKKKKVIEDTWYSWQSLPKDDPYVLEKVKEEASKHSYECHPTLPINYYYDSNGDVYFSDHSDRPV